MQRLSGPLAGQSPDREMFHSLFFDDCQYGRNQGECGSTITTVFTPLCSSKALFSAAQQENGCVPLSRKTAGTAPSPERHGSPRNAWHWQQAGGLRFCGMRQQLSLLKDNFRRTCPTDPTQRTKPVLPVKHTASLKAENPQLLAELRVLLLVHPGGLEPPTH